MNPVVYWLKRFGLFLLGVGALVGGVWLAYVLGRKKAASDLQAKVEVDKANLEIDKINAKQYQLSQDAHALQLARLDAVKRVRDAQTQLQAEQQKIEEKYK